MKLSRIEYNGRTACAFFQEDRVLPIDSLARALRKSVLLPALATGRLEALLPTDSDVWGALSDVHQRLMHDPELGASEWLSRTGVKLLPPIAAPNKLLLLAGNYSAHIEEQGGVSAERYRTFPYVFMKPPDTTLVGDSAEVAIPSISPEKIDHEVELAVVIGRPARNVDRSLALSYVAGYTIVNDLSDRGFRPNPQRQQRPRDSHFDWMHGKWHDGFCPCGPNLTTVDEIQDPQQLSLKLWVDGQLRQEGYSSDQVFSVAEVIEFLSSWMTLQPGDIIATGTPSGVGNASGKFLQAGQQIVAEIPGIGHLTTLMVREKLR